MPTVHRHIPKEESQVVWVKWHTPATPQVVTISISSSKGSLSANTITANIVSLDGHEPPDPTATDRNDGFQAPDVPSNISSLANSWNVWSAKWHPNWVWHEHKSWKSGGKWEDEGHWKDDGWWDFTANVYRASLDANMNLLPDDKKPTAKGKMMRSGYGLKISTSADMKTYAPLSHVAGAQTAVTYFPEFGYKTYWRVLDRLTDGLSATFAFKSNRYSTYNSRVYFTPVWYPDGTYTAYTHLEDA